MFEPFKFVDMFSEMLLEDKYWQIENKFLGPGVH